ncbi:hypothetical protein [Mesorhizobium sp. STM 4661]|uniref:hypothetical protein n=1 Tax=Mesorhizobium sp. STM 4661 TaxID=1297570 RepID=UPI0002BF9323|nr:hypothetical protein [Mesorhizobium sp. STM 4661]CCV12920.1 hypothetical protein MESS4_510087 [Mesorhizobium sp. STM 4661]
MSRLFVGNQDGLGPVLKIFKNDLDDPDTVPDTATGKHLFNSRIQKVGYLLDIFTVEADFATYPDASSPTGIGGNLYYLPAGSNEYNCQIMIRSFRSTSTNKRQVWNFFEEYFTANYGLPYFPLTEIRTTLDFLSNKFRGPYVDLTTGQDGDRGQVYSFGGFKSRTVTVNDTGDTGPPGRERHALQATVSSSGAINPVLRALVSVFSLPMMSDAIPNYATTPVPGQETIRIGDTANMVRIALPGRSLSDTDPKRFILHEDMIPAKVMAAGEITVPTGGTATITTRLPMPDTTYMDYIARRSSETTFWHPPYISSLNESQSLDFTYVISGNTLTITSESQHNLVLRYAIFADSGEAHTTGGSKILLKGSDSTGPYIQIKRPGSSDTAPSMNDIMLDTRLTYLPILAEGFLDWSGDFPTDLSGSDLFKGERMTSVTVPNPDGLLLFPKLGAIYNLPDNEAAANEPGAIWSEHGVFVNAGSSSGVSCGFSTWANIVSTTQVDIYASGNNPYTARSTDSSFDSYDAQLKGVRYYIFGIPQSL